MAKSRIDSVSPSQISTSFPTDDIRHRKRATESEFPPPRHFQHSKIISLDRINSASPSQISTSFPTDDNRHKKRATEHAVSPTQTSTTLQTDNIKHMAKSGIDSASPSQISTAFPTDDIRHKKRETEYESPLSKLLQHSKLITLNIWRRAGLILHTLPRFLLHSQLMILDIRREELNLHPPTQTYTTLRSKDNRRKCNSLSKVMHQFKEMNLDI
ncbi:hypothetical protein AVEN_93990-1 [Araneus ventricosus]|uniref:Uncharacterized protein n=1 Tax=Araneus ventricosus TaxID=182803 RepID=A0A4Y2CJR8_ARAVE|nr:hypothetical protein AVEN_93990-1 [Araneus ventricosus]